MKNTTKNIVAAALIAAAAFALVACSGDDVNNFAHAGADSMGSADTGAPSPELPAANADAGAPSPEPPADSAGVETQPPETQTDGMMVNIATIFENADLHAMTLGLRPVGSADERSHAIFGLTHGYTYFDFTGEIRRNTGDGVLSRVAFGNSPNPSGGSDFSIGMDTRVFVEIDGEWRYAWFFSTQLWLRAVMPLLLWGDHFGSWQNTPALLVVGASMADNDVIRIVTLRDGEIGVYGTNFEDVRPHWYWPWREEQDGLQD